MGKKPKKKPVKRASQEKEQKEKKANSEDAKEPDGISKSPLIAVGKLDLRNTECDTLLVSLFKNKAKLDPAAGKIDSEFGSIISSCLKDGYFKGEKDEVKTLYKGNVKVSLLGLGEENKLTLEAMTDSVACALRKLRDAGFKRIGIVLDSFPLAKFNDELGIEKLTIAALLGLYNFVDFKTKDREKINYVEKVALFSDKYQRYKQASDNAKIIAEAVNKTRDLINIPPNIANPDYVANYCSEMARNSKLKCRVLNENDLKKQGMNLMLAVAEGSANKPRLVVLEYNGGGSRGTIVLAGKGITFDSGGLNVKQHPFIQNMKDDKAGACTVIHVIEAAAKLKLPVNVVAIAGLCENMISGTSYRPDDVITSHSGLTVEVKNTDAEGRMVLADVLSYSLQYSPEAIIDVATLTGATKIILGPYGTPVMGNDAQVFSRIKCASAKSFERVWELPMWKEYDDELKSDIADLQHLNNEGNAGTIVAAAFLKNFVKDAKWAHLDIASTCMLKENSGVNPKGVSGVSVRLLIEMLGSWR